MLFRSSRSLSLGRSHVESVAKIKSIVITPFGRYARGASPQCGGYRLFYKSGREVDAAIRRQLEYEKRADVTSVEGCRMYVELFSVVLPREPVIFGIGVERDGFCTVVFRVGYGGVE